VPERTIGIRAVNKSVDTLDSELSLEKNEIRSMDSHLRGYYS
jgi:hypothetical protein